jgi:hypothetical protein
MRKWAISCKCSEEPLMRAEQNDRGRCLVSRRVITTELQTAGGGETVDGYFDKIVKYIPADIIGAWIFAAGAIKGATDVPSQGLLWVVFGVLLIITPIWILRLTALPGRPPSTVQAAISTGAFAVWVFALGGPFAEMSFYRPLYGSLLLAFYTLVAPLINPPESLTASEPDAEHRTLE